MKYRHSLSVQQARIVMLSTMSLLHHPSRSATKKDVLQTIEDMSLLQIDTINVVNRSPYLVLWSRLGAFTIETGSARCYLNGNSSNIGHMKHVFCPWSKQWLKDHRKDTNYIIDHITRHGPVTSSTFKSSSKPAGGWWNWKMEKLALPKKADTF